MSEIAKTQEPQDFFNELFDFSDVDPVEIKKTAIASNFCALIDHAGLNRAELAKKLDWKPSRLSKVLNGTQNLTIKTIVELCVALDYDFDIHFHKANEHRSLQPWESNLLMQVNGKVLVKYLDTGYDYMGKFAEFINNNPTGYEIQNTLDVTPKQIKTRNIY